ncbi:MAG: hypothetical protein RBR78_06850 [Flavobacteriaceae bacterium]|nr:hypothetical protein [Flavobacteriaceae bacterium]
MEKIEIPYHLIIPSIASFIGLLLIFFNRKKLFKKKRIFWISVSVFFILYLIIVGKAFYDSIFYQLELHRLDLNNDGFFNENELTEELNAVMKKQNNDVGRNFSFITGFVFSLLISLLVYVFGKLFFRKKTEQL